MNSNATALFNSTIVWKEIELEIQDDLFVYEASNTGNSLLLRLNDYPDEILYTLFIDGQPQIDFEDWPKSWKKTE